MPSTTRKSLSRPDPPTGGEGFSTDGDAPRWTLATAEGCRVIAHLAVSLIVIESRGRAHNMMHLPGEVRVGYAERLLRDANAWLAERAEIPERSRSRFIQRVRQLARKLILEDAGFSGGGASAERHL